MQALLTSKGQLTLPKAARDALHLKAGQRLIVDITPDGKLTLTPFRVNALAVRGLLKSPHPRALSVEEMDEGIAQHLREKHAPVTKRTRRAR